MLAAIALITAAPVAGQEYWEYPATISSTGLGTASAEPDVASVTFGVSITRSTPDGAVDEAGRLMESAMAAARSEGVRGQDMQTTSYNLWVQEVWDDYDYAYTGEMEYVVTHYVQAEVTDINSVGDVLAAVVEAGANSITGVYFHVEDTAALYEEARVLAARNAVEKAEQLAEAFGVELGELQSISEWTNSNYGYGYDSAYYNYGGGAGYTESPPVTPGAYSITVEVSATYEIVQ
ncbi:MAG: hypothetical protein AVO35_04635 [Candidatus Aegiribacteria sp. MLS_C]|nr:MAG: hypothetical protein AVO35_04635 [Candidatus Aegiribacteria sp. MLS_C]